MKLNIALLLVVFGWISPSTRADNSFSIEGKHLLYKELKTVFNKSKDIQIFDTDAPISSLSITGKIKKQDDNYLVRVLLKDKSGQVFCVLEQYNEKNDDESFSFTDYCEETKLLANIVPDSLKIIVKNAILEIKNIGVSNEREIHQMQKFIEKQNEIRKSQVKSIARKINIYNETHKKLWGAGVTNLSMRSYAERMRMLGLNDNESTEGVDYYIDGIFESGSRISTPLVRSNEIDSCVEQFDWRNRHGRNWITPIRDQGWSSFCYAFCAVGVIEAVNNIYYNRLINLDLSEDDAARCPYDNDRYRRGGLASWVLEYAKNNGICDENAIQFKDSCCVPCRRDSVMPNEIVRIDTLEHVGTAFINRIKKALIAKGPLTCGYPGHAMALVGYRTIKEGDVISIHTDSNIVRNVEILGTDSLLIGKTYWIFKNSWGTNAYGNIEGYWYIMFNNLFYMKDPYSITRPYCTINTSNNVPICEDRDGDGYYFWGLGPKPANCPSWVPDEPDGDESDINYGPMDEYGYLEQLTCGYTINDSTTYTGNQTLSCRIGIVNEGVLTITGTTTMSGSAKIRVCEGGTLIVDGGIIQNADLTLIPGCSVIIRNGGVINMASENTFEAPVGAVVNIESGEIN
jgi:hypothetical protein